MWRYGGSVHPRIWVTLDTTRADHARYCEALRDDLNKAHTELERMGMVLKRLMPYAPLSDVLYEAKALLKEKGE